MRCSKAKGSNVCSEINNAAILLHFWAVLWGNYANMARIFYVAKLSTRFYLNFYVYIIKLLSRLS